MNNGLLAIALYYVYIMIYLFHKYENIYFKAVQK